MEQKLFDKDTSLCLYLKEVDNTKIKVSLKDTSSNTYLFEKEFQVQEKNLIIDTHKISDELLPKLTGEKSICLNSLAYSKTLSPRHKVICLSDYACNGSKIIVPTKTVNIAPCWHTKAPIVFYSQFTNVNNRLMSVNLKTRKHSIVCSYDGLNMQPSFSKDGCKAVLCLSGGKNSELYLYDQNICKQQKKRVFVKLTNNKANNISPCLLDNGNIVFCSDYQTKQPQIYYLDRKTKNSHRLTNGRGYCAAPSYCSKTNTIVYSRLVNNTFQLFSLNLDNPKNSQEKQLTFTEGNKHESSFSDCGRFIAFSYDCTDKSGNKTTQISVLNCNSGKIRILTNGKEPKSFPRWSNQTTQ